MRIAYALLADAAQVSSDGKVSLLGGDVRTITAESVPVEQAVLAIVFRIVIEANDPQDSELEVKLEDSHEQKIAPIFKQRLVVGDEDADALDASIPAVLTYTGLKFDTFGTYRFVLRVDGKILAQVPLRVIQSSVLPEKG